MARAGMFAALCVALLAGCATTGQDKGEAEDMRTQLFETRSTLRDVTRRLEDMDNKLLLLGERVTEVEAARTSAEAAPVPVDSGPPEGMRVVKLTDAPQGAPAPGQTTASNKRPEALYNEAQEFYMSGRYADARTSFDKFVQDNPEHALADNALYWAGETYYSEKSFEKAIEKFEAVVKRYPDGNKTPDALLKVGYSYREIKQADMAKEAFGLVLQYYPNTEAAKKAKAELERR